MDKDLKPCPFCGEHGKPYFEEEKVFEHIRGKEMTMYKIECGECLLTTPFKHPDKDALKKWWNTRATDCPAVDVDDIVTEIYNSNGFCDISSDV